VHRNPRFQEGLARLANGAIRRQEQTAGAGGRSRKQERTAEAEERTIFHFSFLIFHLAFRIAGTFSNEK
jgi:hypothetical protein